MSRLIAQKITKGTKVLVGFVHFRAQKYFRPCLLGAAGLFLLMFSIPACVTPPTLAVTAPVAAQPVRYFAVDGRSVSVTYHNAEDRVVAVLWDGTRLELPLAVSASGARFSDGTWAIWNKGDKVMVLDEKADRMVFEGVEHPKPVAAVAGSKGWCAAVEAVVRVTDAEGHGPDIGSEEWMGAVTKKVFRVHGEAVPVLGSKEWFEQVDGRVFPGARSGEGQAR